MNDRAEQQQDPGGFSLSSLFLLVALFAVVSAHISPLLNSAVGGSAPPNTGVLVFVCGVSGVVAGLIVGLNHYRRKLGFILGLLLGAVCGAMGGPIMAASVVYPQHTLLISVIGSFLFLGMTALFRRINDHDPVARRDVYEAMLNDWHTREDKHD